jgi:hypothetical protein
MFLFSLFCGSGQKEAQTFRERFQDREKETEAERNREKEKQRDKHIEG